MERKMFYNATTFEFKKAAFLRHNLTSEEKLLWEKLRRKQFPAWRFKCQHPIGSYIVDFYCHSLKLAIEVDGENHRRAEQKLYDKIRTQYLEKFGISVLRYTNEQVSSDMQTILNDISDFAERRCRL
jgi:very-short-patch-repair endonuclease